MRYDKSIDRIRGVLVMIMVYAHVLQFFGNTGAYPSIEWITQTINVLVFPTFVFCFGRSAAMAYLQKPFRKAAPKLAKTAMIMYCVFVLSGLGYRLLVDGSPFNAQTVNNILLLSDMPGWSEFLAGFGAYAVAVLVLFVPLRWLSTRLAPSLIAGAVCLGLCFLPYDLITSKQAGLFIGSSTFACFPVVQYAPYLLAGIYWQTTKKHGLVLSLIGTVATVAGVVYMALDGLPTRFPPSLPWVLLTGVFPALMSFAMAKVTRVPSILEPADGWLCNMGRRSLFYLLASNLTIFALSGSRVAPIANRLGGLFWSQRIASPFGGLIWTAILIIAIGLLASLAGRTSQKQPRVEEKAA